MKAEQQEKSSDKCEICFHKLTPSSDAEISVYEEALGYVFTNNDVRNIALSGPYGAGKSSVLEGCKKKIAHKKFLHISLADFKPHSANDADESKRTPESVLEAKILNQLIHQIPSGAIPQTGFSVKKRFGRWRPLIDTVWLVAIILLTLYQFFFSEWKNLIGLLEYEWLARILGATTSHTMRLLLLVVEIRAL